VFPDTQGGRTLCTVRVCDICRLPAAGTGESREDREVGCWSEMAAILRRREPGSTGSFAVGSRAVKTDRTIFCVRPLNMQPRVTCLRVE
jgi:hypothetical protein